MRYCLERIDYVSLLRRLSKLSKEKDKDGSLRLIRWLLFGDRLVCDNIFG